MKYVRYWLRSSSLLASVLLCGAVFAQEVSKSLDLNFESPILVKSGPVTITLADFVAYLDRRVPKEDHRELISSASRIETVLQNVALTEAFWYRASDEGLSMDGNFQARVYQAAVREAREVYRERLREEIELDDYSDVARELFIVSPERFVRPVSYDLQHLLVAVGNDRPELESMKRVLVAHERLSSGEDFATVAAEMSDDPTFADNQGVLKGVEMPMLAPSLRQALETLNVGGLSMPVQSRFGWHIIKLTRINAPENMTWEEAKPLATDIARERHIAESYERLLREMNSAPLQFAEGAVQAILDHYGATGFGVPDPITEESASRGQ